MTVNWLTASQSLLEGLSKSMTRAWSPAHPTLRLSILDLNAVHQHPVEGAVPGFQGGTFGAGQLAEGVVQGVGGEGGVELGESVAQALLQDDLSVVGALGVGGVRGDVRAVEDPPVEAGEPVKGGLLNVGFGEGGQISPSIIDQTRW